MPIVSAGSPVRAEAIAFIHSEIARVGVDNIDRTAIVKIYMAKGVSRARAFAWIKEEVEAVRNPPPPGPDPLEVEVARAEAMVLAGESAAALAALPTQKEMTKLTREVRQLVDSSRSVPVPPLAVVESRPESLSRMGIAPVPDPVVAVAEPRGAGAIMDRLNRAIDTVEHCIAYSYGENGKVRNPRMALASAETLRKCLETALRLQEAVNNVQAIQAFMDEIMAVLREGSPEVAAAVIERLRGVTGRWAG